MATSSKLIDEVRAMMEQRRNGGAPEATKHSPATPPEAWFAPEPDGPLAAGGTPMSSLIPNWRTGVAPDVSVTVHTAAEHGDYACRVPAVNPYYRPSLASLSTLLYALTYTSRPIMMTGPAGVGKSSMAEYAAAILCRPFFRFNFNGSMDSSALLGTISATAGSTQWHDGLIAEAIQVPYAIILMDEWTTAPAEVVMALQYLLEPNGKLMLADKPGTAADKFIVPAEGVRIIFADNTKGNGDPTGRYVGTQPQNSATLDRIGTFVEVGYLDPADEIAMLSAYQPTATNRLLRSMVRVAGLCRTAVEQGSLTVPMSSRVLQAWIGHALNLRDYKAALALAYLNRLDSESERTAVQEFVQTVFAD